MAALSTFIAVGTLALAAGATAIQISQASKASKLQRTQRNIEAARERRKQVREARRVRAALVNRGAQQAGISSSSVQTAAGSVQSQLGTNLSFLDTTLASGNAISSARSKSNTFGAISEVGFQAFSAFGGPNTIAQAITPTVNPV